jgi:Uncharacterised protein family (UPF0149)
MRAQALAHEVATDSVDLEALDKFLVSDRSPPDSMMLSELDGFLTGIAIGPELVRPSEWLPLIWGGEAPEFADLDEANAILGSLMVRYNEILREILRALGSSSAALALGGCAPTSGRRQPSQHGSSLSSTSCPSSSTFT